MIIVHHLNNSRSQRILWLLEELKLPYEVRRYERNKKTMLAPPELKAIHPLGKSPLISDGEITVAESGAIVEYLLDHYGDGKLHPVPGAPGAHQFKFWLHYAEGSLQPLLLLSLVFHKVETSPLPFFVKPVVKLISANVKKAFISPQLDLHLDYIEDVLNKNLWLMGEELTAADIMMSFPLEAASVRGVLGPREKIKDFLRRVHERPAFQRALEKGGEYSLKF